jgi:hypothetical protein
MGRGPAHTEPPILASIRTRDVDPALRSEIVAVCVAAHDEPDRRPDLYDRRSPPHMTADLWVE